MTRAKTLNASASARSSRERLSPTQQAAFDSAMEAFHSAPVVLIESAPGMGKTTVLRAMHRKTGGKFLTIEDIQRAHARCDGRGYELVVRDVVAEAVASYDVIYFDGVDNFQTAAHASAYHRPNLFDAVFKALYDTVNLAGKHFVFSGDRQDMPPSPDESILHFPLKVTLRGLRQADYEAIFAARLGEAATASIDFEKVYRFSKTLSGYFLNSVCDQLIARGLRVPSTADVVEVLSAQLLRSNVDVREVEKISFSDLKGVDALVERLDRTILLPLRDPELAKELGLEPKRGVLLHGAPGSGKTTIGRALAHMMRGKFFMIDGDFNHQAPGFFAKVQALFESAQRNSPSVIFIDDADVILTDPRLAYFGRYLLTQLDGLMNEASSRVCVMMTAMNLRDMPLALLRSGRLEVWLETKLPDQRARGGIIQSYVEKLPIKVPQFDVSALAGATDGFTPADLRRMVSDATGHLALDRHFGTEVKPLDAYLTVAAGALRAQKSLAAEAFKKRGGRSNI